MVQGSVAIPAAVAVPEEVLSADIQVTPGFWESADFQASAHARGSADIPVLQAQAVLQVIAGLTPAPADFQGSVVNQAYLDPEAAIAALAGTAASQASPGSVPRAVSQAFRP